MTTEKPKTPRKAPAKPRAAKVKDKLAPMIAEAPSAEEAEVRRTRLKTLIALGKERGYLTYAEINDHLPDDLVDAEQIVVFQAQVSALIPLYAVGVFTGFSLSQFGMIKHHLSLREPKWQRGLAINAVGCVATTIVLGVVVYSKFTIGAWIPVVVIPMIVLVFRTIKNHYLDMDRRLAAAPLEKVRRRTNTVVVLVGKVTKGSLTALAYARSLNPDKLVAVTVVSNSEEQERISAQWEEHDIAVDLVTLYSPYRELTRPIMRYIDDLDARTVDDFVTVVVPEFTLDKWWHQLLHNQSALVLRTRLRGRPNTIVTSVPFHVDPAPDPVREPVSAPD